MNLNPNDQSCESCGSFGFHRTGCAIWEAELDETERRNTGRMMRSHTIDALKRLINHVEADEARDFAGSTGDRKKRHIFNDISRLRAWANEAQ